MKNIIILLTVSVSIIFTACKKNESIKNNDDSEGQTLFGSISSLVATPTSVYGALRFGYHQIGFGNTTNGVFQLGGGFFSDTPNQTIIDIGQITFAGNSFNFNNANLPTYKYSNIQASDYSLNTPLFGVIDTFNFSGNSNFPNTSVSIYNPTVLNVSSNFTNNHNKTNNINLTWNPDASNPSGKVYIYLNYQSAPSIRLNSSNPSTYPSIDIETDDDGSHTISSSDLTSLPSNSIWNIYIVRFNEIIETINSKDYQFVTYSLIQKEFTLLP